MATKRHYFLCPPRHRSPLQSQSGLHTQARHRNPSCPIGHYLREGCQPKLQQLHQHVVSSRSISPMILTKKVQGWLSWTTMVLCYDSCSEGLNDWGFGFRLSIAYNTYLTGYYLADEKRPRVVRYVCTCVRALILDVFWRFGYLQQKYLFRLILFRDRYRYSRMLWRTRNYHRVSYELMYHSHYRRVRTR